MSALVPNIPDRHRRSLTSTPEPLDPIAVFAPWSGPADRPLRQRLHRAGTMATARATRSKHGGARALFWQAAQAAQARTFARIDVAQLEDGIRLITYLFLAANIIERTETPDAD